VLILKTFPDPTCLYWFVIDLISGTNIPASKDTTEVVTYSVSHLVRCNSIALSALIATLFFALLQAILS
jgi:hypothetical protein